MSEVVPLKFHSRLFSRFRLSSVAGGSFVERMRSTAFALLGLTAAAGLVLVAIFAQPGGPLLAPAPLPEAPPSSVAGGEAVGVGQAPQPSEVPVSATGGRLGAGPNGQTGEGTGAGGGSTKSGGTGRIGSPQPVNSPPASGGGVAGNGVDGPEGTTAPVASPPPEADTTPSSVPVASPAAPEKTQSVQASSPGRSTADTHHGKGQGSKPSHGNASHGSAPPAPPPPAPTPPVAEAPATAPGGNGKGHAYGHDK